MSRSPGSWWFALVLVIGCQAEPGEPTATAVATMGSTGTESSTAGSTGTPTTTETSSGSTTGSSSGGMSGATTVDDGCQSYAIGGWNACEVGTLTCEWMASEAAGELLCLSPGSGPYNVCGIRDCVDVCDCFAPPATGTAVPVCAAILGSGKNGCALYCAGGQTCPDGMECYSGYCYWPNE